MDTITFTTAQAESTEAAMSAVFDYLAAKLGVGVTAVYDISWDDRIRWVAHGDIDVGWVCGSYYTRLVDRPGPVMELLAAPVMAPARYGGQPVYYSDVIVRKDSRYRSFEDLWGAVFAYNEPGSMSGYWTMRYALAEMGYRDGFFNRLVGSGGHVKSIGMVLAGEVDTAAIDSTVMDTELAENPGLADELRIVKVLGPTPIPPWVVRRGLAEGVRSELRRALVEMNEDEMGRRVLDEVGMRGFSVVPDGNYDRVREMIKKAAEVAW